MKPQHFKRFSVVICTIFLFISTFSISQVQAFKRTQVVEPGEVLSHEEMRELSSMGAKAIRSISRAREMIDKDKRNEAIYELQKARTLLTMIENGLPTLRVRDSIHFAQEQIKYVKVGKVKPNLLPIYENLIVIENFENRKKARQNLDKARASLEKGDNRSARKHLGQVEKSIISTEIDLPVIETQTNISKAMNKLGQEEMDEAEKILEDTQENILVFVDKLTVKE